MGAPAVGVAQAAAMTVGGAQGAAVMVGVVARGAAEAAVVESVAGVQAMVGAVVGATGVAKKDQVTEVAEEEGAVEGKARVTGAALVGPCPLGY